MAATARVTSECDGDDDEESSHFISCFLDPGLLMEGSKFALQYCLHLCSIQSTVESFVHGPFDDTRMNTSRQFQEHQSDGYGLVVSVMHLTDSLAHFRSICIRTSLLLLSAHEGIALQIPLTDLSIHRTS